MSYAGSFLIARPVLEDPNFSRTVVLLLAHTADGAFGVVVNRPIPAEGVPFPVFEGGPCRAPGVVILHGHADWTDPPAELTGEPNPHEIAPGIFVGNDKCLSRVTEPVLGSVRRFRVFRNFAGWGAGQLEQEIASGAWALAPATAQVLFDTPVEELWERLVPPRIPQPSLN